MWTKNKPDKPGYYWVCVLGELSGKEYVHPVHVYSSKGKVSPVDMVFSDGDIFSIDSDKFVEWYSEQIAMPAKT